MSMPLSSPEQVQKSNDFLYNLKTPECPGCARGVRMCYHTPCIGTVDDMEKLINAGHAKLLMLDWFCGFPEEMKGERRRDNPFTEDILYLAPAIVGMESKEAPFARTGKCTFLENNMCKLHDQNLKPIQGRLACCKVERVYEENGAPRDLDERIPVLHTWNTQRGKDLIERWKREVEFGSEELKGNKPPETFADQLLTMLNVMDSMTSMQSAKGKDGRPDYDPNEILEKDIQVYEKPY